ncbi:MAG: hypothetical protein HY303_12295 [Candidatus Wallbacteria bacterium]|nr:hypothetical protein [Candidatus Wallbacteria bacterium]
MQKQEVIELLQDLEEPFDTEELLYRLYLRQKLEAAEAAAGDGSVVSHDEVIRQAGEWRK